MTKLDQAFVPPLTPTALIASNATGTGNGNVPSIPTPTSKVLKSTTHRAVILTEWMNRSSVGSADRCPVMAGVNVACDASEVVLSVTNHHAHWTSVCAQCLHVLSNILMGTAM